MFVLLFILFNFYLLFIYFYISKRTQKKFWPISFHFSQLTGKVLQLSIFNKRKYGLLINLIWSALMLLLLDQVQETL